MKRPVIIVAVAVAVMALYVMVIMPLSEERPRMKETLHAKYSTLQKYEAFLKTSGKAGSALGGDTIVKEVENMGSALIQDTNESLAFARLQGHIQDFAEKSGVKIISIKPLSVVKYKHYSSLPIQLEANSGIVQVGGFLKQLEESKQLIGIDRLSINVMSTQMPGDLKIRMQVSGLMKANGS